VKLFGIHFGEPEPLSKFEAPITREELIKHSRIVVIDDEIPLIIEELQQAGFSVDHDKTGDVLSKYDNQLYDIAIIDFHGVGQRLGPAHGLDLLNYIKRVSPGTRLIAHTSRSLSAAEAQFFRESHVVLPKDLGLGESMKIIEEQLRIAYSKEHIYEAMLSRLQVTTANNKNRIRKELSKSLTKKDQEGFKNFIGKFLGQTASRSVSHLIAKVFLFSLT
jgi:hypothetical protein